MIRSSAFLASILLAAVAPAQPAKDALPAVQQCPYTPAELGAALGLKFDAGKGFDSPFPGGKEVSCSYPQADGFTTLYVLQMVMSAADLALGQAQYEKMLAGRAVLIAGDRDGARWQLDSYNENNLALLYTRGGARVEVRAAGGRFKVAEMQPKLLKLRRLP